MTQAQAHPRPDDLALQAEMAGAALGCHFSSSTEYEAALIAERRKAGAYRAPLWQQMAPWMVVLLAAVVMTLSL